nr:MAG TPA: TFIIB zinc-binding [Caudoviricetes sp.]
MIPEIEYCNWEFEYTDKNKWLVKRDCCDEEILLTRGDSRNWKAYEASLKPYPVGGYPDIASICPNCGKYVNGVNPHDDGETWRE